MVLIFTNRQDVHPAGVMKHLAGMGVPVFRFNTERLLTDYRFSWWCGPDDEDFLIEDIKSGQVVYGHEITAIWDRRAEIPKALPQRHKERSVNKFNRDEAHGFLSFLRYYLKDVYSIGSITGDRPAESKMLQLSVARRLGMDVPDTCFGNYKEAFRGLCDRHGDISIKSIDGNSIFVGGEQEYVLYAQKGSSQAVMAQSEAAFSQTVCFLQNYVPKQYELRVTVCCEDVVACKLDSQALPADKGAVDWRQGYMHGLRHEIVELPEHVRAFCLKYLKEMGLNFGCFDFIVTPEGRYVFLECNPNGQWLWIEIYTGYDISAVIAGNLARYEK